ncbi:MAG: hypothetical protein MUC49_06665 [Raineya sp.]|jgi:hypothetical protein|nr:hypothetical protein [Raineya sp.]
MKTITLTFILFLNFLEVFGQTTLQKKKLNDRYSWKNNVSQSKINYFYFKLRPLQSSPYKTHIRIEYLSQVVDLYSNDNIYFESFLTNIITKYPKDENKKMNSSKGYAYYFEKIALNSEKAKLVVNKLYETQQPAIPTDSLIPHWNNLYIHCSTLTFEYRIEGKYHQQEYSCLQVQDIDSVAYTEILLNNLKFIKKELSLDSLYTRFLNKLPKGKSYSRNGYGIMYIPTKKENLEYLNSIPQLQYLKPLKDTITNFLKYEVSKLNIKNTKMYKDYSLAVTFDKQGNIENIKPVYERKEDRVSYFKRKKDSKIYSKKIKEICKNIPIVNLKLEYGFTRVFHINNQFQIWSINDDTFYP